MEDLRYHSRPAVYEVCPAVFHMQLLFLSLSVGLIQEDQFSAVIELPRHPVFGKDGRIGNRGAWRILAQARYQLVTVESQARVARLEWERIAEERSEEPNPLVLFEPQLENARSAVAAAEAGLEQLG